MCFLRINPLTLVQLAPAEENHILYYASREMDTDRPIFAKRNSSNGTERFIYSLGFNVTDQWIRLNSTGNVLHMLNRSFTRFCISK